MIDCPPALGILTINALTASDGVIIPMQPQEVYALYGMNLLLSTIEELQDEANPELSLMGGLITMHDGRLRIHREMTEQINHFLKGKVFDTSMKTNTTLKEALRKRGRSSKLFRGSLSIVFLNLQECGQIVANTFDTFSLYL